MTLQMIGLAFDSAPLELREALVFDRGRTLRFLPELLERTGLLEAVLLSTCNRTELYAVPAESSGPTDPAVAIMRFRGIEPDPGAWVRKRNEEALEHLFAVTSGLRSLVKGEAQILGQVKDAYRLAVESLSTGPVLNRVFHAAFRTGKRVRSETGIGEGAVSVSQAAVELASREAGMPLPEARILVLGAGEMAGLVVRHLAGRKARRVVVANRTLDRARALAADFGYEARPLDTLPALVARSDVVFSACAADGYLLGPDHLNGAPGERFVVDIGIPRTVDPALGRFPGCRLRNLDALNGLVTVNRERREAEATRGEAIVREEVAGVLKWIAARRNASLIQSLADYMETLRARELKRVCREAGLSEEEKLDRLSLHLVRKITQPLIKKINDARACGDERALAAALDLLREVYRI